MDEAAEIADAKPAETTTEPLSDFTCSWWRKADDSERLSMVQRITHFATGRVDGTKAVGLFNLGPAEMTVQADFATLKLEGKQTVRDLWRQKDVATAEGTYEAKVPPHGVVLLKLTPAK